MDVDKIVYRKLEYSWADWLGSIAGVELLIVSWFQFVFGGIFKFNSLIKSINSLYDYPSSTKAQDSEPLRGN